MQRAFISENVTCRSDRLLSTGTNNGRRSLEIEPLTPRSDFLSFNSPITVCCDICLAKKMSLRFLFPPLQWNYNIISLRNVLLLSQPRYTADKETWMLHYARIQWTSGDKSETKPVRNDKTGILVLQLPFMFSELVVAVLAILCVGLIPSEPEWCQELRLGRE